VTLACPGFVAESQGAISFVTTTAWKISSSGGCSLQEAIYSANFDNNIAPNFSNPTDLNDFIPTQCVAGNGDDIIVLPDGAVFQMFGVVIDARNPFGPTATPREAAVSPLRTAPSRAMQRSAATAGRSVTSLSESLPVAGADIAPLQTGTANVAIDFTGCAAAARFTAKFAFSANGGAVVGNVVRYNQFE
jgi:hypothetical protein